MTSAVRGLREALEADMAMIDEGIAKSRNPNREGFITCDRLRAILDQHPDGVPSQPQGDPHCEDGCSEFEWGEWVGIDGPVLLCIKHGRPGPGSAYETNGTAS